MAEQGNRPNPEVDVLLVGQTGVGKSTLINMIMGVQPTDKVAAKVSGDAIPCTQQTTPYGPVPLGEDLRCRLWDTRGLGEAVEPDHKTIKAKIADLMDRIFRLKAQQEHSLLEALRKHIDKQTKPILMWCMDAGKIEVREHWESFFKVYVEYCGKKVIPVIVVTRMPPGTGDDWEKKCRIQLGDTDVRLIRVRNHQKLSLTECGADSSALKTLLSGLVQVEVNNWRREQATHAA